RRNLPPVLHGLGRLPASLTILVIGDIGVILIRKETQCQRVKGVIVQRLFHPPVQDCQQVTIKCFHVVHHHVPPSPPHPNLPPPGGKDQTPRQLTAVRRRVRPPRHAAGPAGSHSPAPEGQPDQSLAVASRYSPGPRHRADPAGCCLQTRVSAIPQSPATTGSL